MRAPIQRQAPAFRYLGVNTAAQAAEETTPSAPDPAGPQVLDFIGGDALHGALTALEGDRQSLSWQRTDASAPLELSTNDVRRISFGAAAAPAIGHAIVKFAGGDWVAADLIEMVDREIRIQLPGEEPVSVERSQVQWVYFSPGPAPDCYEGPTSFSGWSSGGGWSYRDGALHAGSPSIIGRDFDALPDKVDYLLNIDQGSIVDAFTIILHDKGVVAPSQAEGAEQIQFLNAQLRAVAPVDGAMKTLGGPELASFNLPGANSGEAPRSGGQKSVFEAHDRPLQVRVLEDRPDGRLIVLINGKKVVEWSVDKCKPGENHGAFCFQPLGWGSSAEQAISRVRVIPWDGVIPDENAPDVAASASDSVTFLDGQVKRGTLEDFGGDSVKLRTAPDDVLMIPREKIAFLRFKRSEDPADEDPPIAHMTLAQRGEFDVSGLRFHEGKLVVQTAFSTEFTLTPAAVRALEFFHLSARASEPADEIVFRNGDRVHGALEAAADNGKLRWRTVEGTTAVEFDPAGVSGVLFAPIKGKAAETSRTTVRCRNGDVLIGDAIALDKERLTLDTAQAGRFAISRKNVRAVYFSAERKPIVLSSAAGASLLQNQFIEGNYVFGARSDKLKEESGKRKNPDPWRYFDGAFTFPGGAFRSGALRAGLSMDDMPENVELAFDVSVPKGPALFSVQLFSSEPNSGGYLLQLQPQQITVYDMQPRQRGGRVLQQQYSFIGKVEELASERHFRLFTDRVAGKVAITMDGVNIGVFGPKGGNPAPRNLGSIITLAPQPGIPSTFSNFWLGPWNGRLPDPAASSDATAPDSVVLSNGDETHGVVQSVADEVIKLDCDAGQIELPVPRTSVIEIGSGAGSVASAGTRLRFTGLGVITVKSYRVAAGMVTFETDLGTTLKLPLSDLREMDFASSPGS